MEEFVYVIADNEFYAWSAWYAPLTKEEKLQFKGIYKGRYNGNRGGMVTGKNGAPWNSNAVPFRQISKIEAFVLSKGKIRWLP